MFIELSTIVCTDLLTVITVILHLNQSKHNEIKIPRYNSTYRVKSRDNSCLHHQDTCKQITVEIPRNSSFRLFWTFFNTLKTDIFKLLCAKLELLIPIILCRMSVCRAVFFLFFLKKNSSSNWQIPRAFILVSVTRKIQKDSPLFPNLFELRIPWF